MVFTLSILLSMLVAYLLGAIPIAMLVSRYNHVDIFLTGTGLPGAANVYRNVGHKQGVVVFVGDAAKGTLGIVCANQMGVDGGWVFLAAVGTLGGHWKPVFTNFKGGDGLSSLMGITLAMMPIYGSAALATGIVGAAIAKTRGHHASLWGGSIVYGLILVRVIAPAGQSIIMPLGLVALAIVVLCHGVIGHRRRVHSTS
jgi:glycerol-3-phosphate acyltransferase PlsY